MKELKALAKEQGIPRYYRMRKAELIEALGRQPRDPTNTPPPHNILDEPIPEINVNEQVKSVGAKKCFHGRNKYYCKDCHGSQICPHNHRKSYCKVCNGSSFCEHKRVRYLCKDCGGKGICIHGRQRWFCKLCGGSQVCEHNRQKYHCRACHATQETRQD